MPDINFELLDGVHKFIDAHPTAHRQGHYADGHLVSSPDQYDESVCGSTACIAGWSAVFAGYEQVGTSQIVVRNGLTYPMHEAGRIALGLSNDQAENLFAGGNTREGIDAMVAALHANPRSTLDKEKHEDWYRRERAYQERAARRRNI